MNTQPAPLNTATAPAAGGWLGAVPHPSLVLVVGRAGSGKSALGHRLLEVHHDAGRRTFVLGFPEAARHLLPTWVEYAEDFDQVPPGVAVLVDEAYLSFHARTAMAAGNIDLARTVGLYRQRDQTVIFVAQGANTLDRNLVAAAGAIVVKELGLLQEAFERGELAALLREAREGFKSLEGDPRAHAFVYSQTFRGMVRSRPPRYWTEALSRAWAAGASTEAPVALGRAAKIEAARALHAQGLSLREIALRVGVRSAGTVMVWLRAADKPTARS